MEEQNGWRMFFNSHAPQYMEECFTQNTVSEADFLEEEFRLAEGASILDIGCGTGRHSAELSRRGYRVTGLDISEGMLREARKVCGSENLEVNFVHADATDFTLDRKFDGCICLCEGAFGLLAMDEDPFERDLEILKNIRAALKPGAKFVMTALNGLRMIRKYREEDVEQGRFDPLGIVEQYPLIDILPEAPERIMIKEKGFLATELTRMLKISGFRVENIWGGTAGGWNRKRLQLDEMEMMVVSVGE